MTVENMHYNTPVLELDDVDSSNHSSERTYEQGKTLESDTRNDVERGDPRDLDSDSDSSSSTEDVESGKKAIIINWKEKDPEDPFQWQKSKKKVVSYICILMTLVVSFSNSGYASGAQTIADEFGVSLTVSLLGITLFVIGFAIAPLALAPLSEVYGRSPIYYSSFFLFTLFAVPIAVAKNIETILICRFIQGCAGSTAATMVGGTLADLWHSEERGTYMSIYSSIVFVGTALGPMVSGFLVFYLNFRWIFYIQIIVCSVTMILLLIFLSETRGSVILSRRAKKMRKETGNENIKAPSDEERKSLKKLIHTSLTRPVYFLTKEPIVIFFTIWLSFVWCILYACLASIPNVLSTSYNFTEWQIGLGFLGMFIGGIGATFLNFIQEYLYKRAKKKNGGVAVPEARLYSSLVGTFIFSGGLFWFGWTSFPNIHWISPIIASSIFTIGMFQMYLATFNYLADSYKRYAASALAAQGLVRSMLGAFFPLFTYQMFTNLGFQWAGTLLGGIALVLSIIPYALFYYGPTIRAKSIFARDSVNEAALAPLKKKQKRDKTIK